MNNDYNNLQKQEFLPIIVRTGKITVGKTRTLSLAFVRTDESKFVPIWQVNFRVLRIEKEYPPYGEGGFRVIEFAVPIDTIIRVFATTGEEVKAKERRRYRKTRTQGAIFRVEPGEVQTWKGPYFQEERIYFRGEAYRLTESETRLFVESKFQRFYS